MPSTSVSVREMVARFALPALGSLIEVSGSLAAKGLNVGRLLLDEGLRAIGRRLINSLSASSLEPPFSARSAI